MALFQFLKRNQPTPAFSLPPDTRAYAIGDVHGCLDQLADLLGQIEADSRAAPIGREFVILLGDLIDRGPDSAGVIDYLLRARETLPNPVFIAGNHEEMLLRIAGGEDEQLRDWLAYGGDACVASYGLDPKDLLAMPSKSAIRALRAAIPPAHLEFVGSFADSFKLGDYLFVHAGVRPGVALKDQTIADLHWIRDDFLNSPARLPYRVVHGHSITRTPDERDYRIGVDTGAYASGTLTAVRIEGTERSFITSRK
ncbi:metallophosphoesterase family protein [Sphingomonas immobilis]|uniref:Metallophosphoesterase family protein n=1 Tax=Sphingomonas immobilis TaxID=3063997 RepID=A0ABT8ZTL8_9SPHN|nr:metallophosphoesterase family protein [Sphingomonas sp. CA1-15]MDO7840913.1 metallophosphoesterase family protein [Sphingomonas sp. CA1-15]